MVKDLNFRTLPQVLALAKTIIDAGKEREFIEACAGKDNYFVVSTDSARQFMAAFLNEHRLSPNDVELHNFRYGGDRCT